MMLWGRILATVLAIGGCSSVIVGCSDTDDDIIRLGVSAQVVTLDPRFATDAVSTRVNRLLYSRLVEFDGRATPIPGIASWIRLSPTHYRFTLESSARFHSERPVTAADVVATYRSVLAPDTASPHRAGLSAVRVVRAVDDRTVDFELSRADPLFPGRLVLGILPKDALEAGRSFAREPAGSGPFQFVNWQDEHTVRLRRRHDGTTLEVTQVARPTVRVLKLLHGELDLVQGDLPRELVGWLRKRSDVKVLTYEGTTFAYLGFNLNDPITSQLAVRRAIAHAIDRNAIITHLLDHTARPASAILPPNHWAGHPELGALPYDPVRARALLKQAGYGPQRPVRIVYKTSNNPLRLRVATIIQAQLAEVGIEVALRSYDWGTFYGDIKQGRFQMYSLAWVGIKMPDIFRYAMHSASVPPVGANRGAYDSARADALIDEAEADDDLKAQARLYRELQSVLLDDLPYVPLWYEDQVAVVRNDVHGYSLGADGNYDGLADIGRREK